MIWALSRTDAEAANPSGLDHVIISITDPDASFANPATNERTLSILRLRFDDFHLVPRGVVFRRPPVMFDRLRADELANFLRKHDWQDVICHCETGVSCSMAVAFAISIHYGLKLVNALPGLHAPYGPVGNPLVFWLTIDALREDGRR